MEDIWEDIHSQRAWGKYPNEELVRFIGRNFFKINNIEKYGLTYENQQKEIIHWIVEARKK